MFTISPATDVQLLVRSIFPQLAVLPSFDLFMMPALTSQIFCHSVYLFTKNKPLGIVIVCFSFSSFICGMVAGIQSGMLGQLCGLVRVALLGQISVVSLLWLVFQTTADITITVSLCWTLWHSRTGFRKTDSLIYRVMRGAIQTGLFVSIFALGDMFSFHFNPSTNLYAMFAYPIGRIYTNTLLDTLLSRREMRSRNTTTTTNGHDIENDLQTSIRLGNVDVNVSHEVRVQRDFAAVSNRTLDGSDRDLKDGRSSPDQKAVSF
ncbi:uncharacterized protein STEHIDRAFT_113280 [Stereum hirsutum FP-91666 SS1]|uniref:uncharacterized protein n=1 Tax=Stereum hirsutum (strain FP-91666) TaxID=721885 RepID=UPI0004449614|nr:uncharacterized protein STEHIDRAFT_113280 [Stereum hirsutum FP-91666 SS1]EIM84085.1 hypothetical protein STEHIDRAFT_113280 [Stereum hirsutum FP-91666 SS1]